MPGLHSMLIGGLIFLGGTCITIFTMTGATGDTGVVFYGAIIFGAIQFIVGLVQFLSYQFKNKDSKDTMKVEAGLRAVIRGMLAVAAADGELEPEEVAMICGVFKSLFGSSLSVDAVVSAFTELTADANYDITREFREIKGLLDEEFVNLTIKSMFLVALSDGVFDRREAQIISTLANYLNMPSQQQKKLKQEAESLISDTDIEEGPTIDESIPVPES